MAETDPAMSAERFAELVGIYGSRIDHWPAGVQDAGRVAAATPAGRAALGAAIDLDMLLDSYVVSPPAAALHGRILASLETPPTLKTRLGAWWRGLGLVGVGIAGVVVGSVAMSTVLAGPAPEADGVYEQPMTVFGDVDRAAAAPEEAR
jgi:hypothetical protein